jgi:hypothetical protein
MAAAATTTTTSGRSTSRASRSRSSRRARFIGDEILEEEDRHERVEEGGRERGTNDTGGRIAPAALTDGIFHGYARGNASQFTPPSPPPESPLPMLPAFCSSAFSCVCLFDSLVLSLFFFLFLSWTLAQWIASAHWLVLELWGKDIACSLLCCCFFFLSLNSFFPLCLSTVLKFVSLRRFGFGEKLCIYLIIGVF